MRCKNCGTDNDNNRYICENCGSPLYDDVEITENEDNGATKAFRAVNNDNDNPESASSNAPAPDKKEDYSKAAEKKSIIVIAILAVVLVAIIVSVVLVAQAKKGNGDESTTDDSTTISTTANTTENTTEYTTKETTESTTEKTTRESTTRETTTETKTYSVKLISKGGGTVDGSGSYADGENVTIVATPDGDYEFDGWYSNGTKLSSSTVYSFTATKDISISAVFIEITTAEEIEEVDGGLY